MYPTISVVINTLNRARELEQTLDSLRWLIYPGEFEVVVVNGPSKDDTAAVLHSWSRKVRVENCDVANLSVSRNIGICMAEGEIVAFIDDDAIPEPEWLIQLSKPYQDAAVGAAGGFVFNHTGYEFQYKFAIVDRLGNADLSPIDASPNFAFPKSYCFPHLLGCNSSFRRSVLLEVEGFDEEFDYYLDETDLCLRIVDAGHSIAQLPCAYVHHKFAASNLRTANRVARDRYSILKNKLYFMLKHAREFHSLDGVLAENGKFVEQQRADVRWAVREKLLSIEDEVKFNDDVNRAFEVGLKRGLDGLAVDAMISSQKLARYRGDFEPFTPLNAVVRHAIVIVSKDFPPLNVGGIATFYKCLAEALAVLGHTVHVIAQSNDINRVDFESGVWVHRMVIARAERPPSIARRQIPEHIWNWSATALAEARRIASHRAVFAVEAAIWDCEGVAFLHERQWPLVTSLVTTLQIFLDYHPEHARDEKFMQTFGRPMLDLERELMTQSDAIRASSLAIVSEIEVAYGFELDSSATVFIPHGIEWREKRTSKAGVSGVTVLFVGRLERRKGIDVLLSAIPSVVAEFPEIEFRIVGDDTIADSKGDTFKSLFLRRNTGMPCLEQTTFCGRIDEEALREAYADCDIFVAPSLFESFGLVFLEAMREGKPVVGCRSGGMPEVVSDGVNGILVEPDSVAELARALKALASDNALRVKMGNAGRELFEERFTSRHMAIESESIYERAESRFKPQ